MKQYIRALSPRLEFAIVVIGAFGIFIVGSLLAVFGPTDRESPPITNDQLQSVIAMKRSLPSCC